MDVVFGGEQDPPPACVEVVGGGRVGVPAVAGELAVGGVEEHLALLLVLADEQDPGGVLRAFEVAVAPPPAQEGVVAAQLVVVLVDPAGAVVLDQEQPRCSLGVAAVDLEDGVGAQQPRVAVREPLG
jgi:hypothetical protein